MTKKKRSKKNNTRKKKIIKYMALSLGVVLIAGLAISAPMIVKAFKLAKEAKSVVSESSYNTFNASQTTMIYDTNGAEMGTMSSVKDLDYLDFTDIPTDVVNAFVIMEDQKFYSHGGVDLVGIARAVVANQKSDHISQGASTITQQLARNIFLTSEVTWQRKIKEAFIAIELEKKYSKDEILEFYLNNIYFANGYYGIEAASKGYFSKSVSELSLSEQAFLAAIPNSPTRYNPVENYDATLGRRNLVLKQMNENNKINDTDYNVALEETITLNLQETAKNNYVDTYVRRCATESMMATYGFTFRYDFKSEEDYNTYKDSYDSNYAILQKRLFNGGYSVYTSINLTAQEELQKSIDDNLVKFSSLSGDGVFEMQGAATCVDNSTGNVIAIVGGRSQELPGYTLNRAYQSYRQPGSSIKPLNVYTPYLQLGNDPNTVVVDEPIEGGPKNGDNKYDGKMTLRDAVRVSKNTVAWKIYGQITPRSGCEFLMKMQFKKIYVDKDIIAGALGGFTEGVSTEEMAGGYATLANDGVYRRATCIVTIKSSDGKTTVDETHRESKVYDVNSSRMMTDMLKTVVKSGTGVLANIDNAIVAGKTGTTNSNKDAWFVGYSKYYTTSVWIGYDMPQEMSSPGQYTCAIWKQFMTTLHTNLPIVDFGSFTLKEKQKKSEEVVTQAPAQEKTVKDNKNEKKKEVDEDSTIESTSATKATGKIAETQKATIQYGDADSTLIGGDQDAKIK
ncbi:transglycosylase domain-containing protein [[Clostridium] fimetarium]|uniref:Penicillin-binding protein 1A n=1 Tax=[Clostridium] fimetarium TaxID=99656 RepID=A0A1I0MVL6_9FIRM|nr:PBP1A family penicillin-binding protein [[Clostridium] fimetarium]SEV92070.1 penicillin-binding protein, 1A family [[Clostridium] fimetarium]